MPTRSCRSLGGLSPASHRDGPGSCPGESCEICGGQSGSGPGSLGVLQFPLPIIPPTARSSSSGALGGRCNSELRSTPPQEIITKRPV
jgi:hypothetical protein